MARYEVVTPDHALAYFRKRYKDEAIGGIGSNVPAPLRVPSGLVPFDVASGGGFPAGNMSIIYGHKDTGKSLLLYDTMATYMERNPDMMAALMDLEGNYDTRWGNLIGINPGQLLTLQPDYGEQAADMISYLIEHVEKVGLICVDSLAQLTTTRELVKSAEDSLVGGSGLLIARLCRKTQALLTTIGKRRAKPTVIYTNQLRANVGVQQGPRTVQPGGKTPGYYASTMVAMYRGKEEVVPDVDPSKPARKALKGVIEKKKGPIVAQSFECDVAILPHDGVRVGRSCNDWAYVSAYLTDMGKLEKLKKGYRILDQEFRLQRECRAWYEQNRDAVVDQLIRYLMDNPEEVE